MTTELDQIINSLSPPDTPRGLNRTWNEVEAEIGLELPDDYKSFVDVYGTGQISSANGWVVVWNFRDKMFASPLRTTLCGDGSVIRSYHSLESTDYPCPFPTYPDSPGLLPFASVNDVQNLNWLTEGSSKDWGVVYYFFDGSEFNELENDSFSECVLKMLRNEYSELGQPSSLEPPFRFTEIE